MQGSPLEIKFLTDISQYTSISQVGSSPRANVGDLAWQLFTTAKNPNCKPKHPSYSILIASLIVQGKPSDEEQNLWPEEYNSLLNGFPIAWVSIHPFLLILTSNFFSYKTQV